MNEPAFSVGYWLSSEEHPPDRLVRTGISADRAGFSHLVVSDHFHPWTSAQGHAPFVWSTLGALAVTTSRATLMTGVTCPLIRTHPVIIAQAAATTADLSRNRFILGLGTGERLNEHVVGAGWPTPDIRRRMLQEAVGIMRDLFTGEEVTTHGEFYDVEHARLFTLPQRSIPIAVAAGGRKSGELAGRLADGLVATSPDRDVVDAFADAGGTGPRIAQLSIAWHDDPARARAIARRQWPNAAMGGDLSQEVPGVRQFEAVAELVDEEDVVTQVLCTGDIDEVWDRITAYRDAGFSCVALHAIGEDQATFMDVAAREILPRTARASFADTAA